MSAIGKALAPFKDIGKSFSYGFDLPHNIKTQGIKGLASGFRPHVGGAIVGAAAGGYLGSQIEEASPAATAAGGAAIGAAALPTIGLLGAGAYGLGAGVINNSDKILKGVGETGKWVGRASMRSIAGPQFVGSTRMGKAAASFGNKLLNPIARHATTIGRSVDKFASYTPRREVFHPGKNKMITKGGFKLGALGWGVIGLGAVVGMTRSASEASDNIRAGARDPYITRATPQVTAPSYANNAGASGDLVFALNANRRG